MKRRNDRSMPYKNDMDELIDSLYTDPWQEYGSSALSLRVI